MASKISRVVGIISRLRHSLPLNTLIQIYRSLIFPPYTYYGIAAWGQAVQVYLRKVFILQKQALRIQLNSFSIFGAKLWNCLKPELRKLRKKPFKNKIHQFLLAVLGNEDDYVDVSTLMLKITNYH